MNIVLDDAVEEKSDGKRERIGMVVIRGNSVVMLEVQNLNIIHMEHMLTRHRRSKEWATIADSNSIIRR